MERNDTETYNDKENLLHRLQIGDKQVFEELYHSYFECLCDFLLRYIDKPEVCEGLVQDLFLGIWIKRENWNPKGEIRPYLYKAARNKALDYLKHCQVERNYIKWQKIKLV